MVVTLPLPASRRLTLARSGRTFWWALWRERRCGDWGPPPPDDDPGGAGVREPRRPIPPEWGGSVALPLDG